MLRVCACAGLGRLSVVAGDGVKIAANASKEANRTEAGLRKLAAQVIAGAARPPPPRRRKGRCCRARTCCWARMRRRRPDPRSRAGRVLACLEDLEGEREAAEAAAREQGQAYLEALAAGTANGRPPAAVALAAQQLRLEQAIAAQEAAVAGWEARKAAGQRVAAGPPPAGPRPARVRQARARLEDLQAGPPRRRRPRPAETGRSRSRGATSPTRTPG